MAWNKPNTENQQKKPSAKAPSAKRGVIAGVVIVVALGALCLYLFSNGEATSSSLQKKERGRIKEVTPAAAPTNRVEAAKEETPYWLVPESETNGFTEVMQRKWFFAHRPPPAYRYDVTFTPPRYAIFDTYSENQIAFLLTAEPGKTVIGEPNYRGITEDFMKSCETPIIINADDDEFDRNLKNLMKETKIELRQRISDGENLEDILRNAREELRQFARYKSTLKEELENFLKDPQHTDQDVDDFIKAANTMLEEKGVAPLELGVIAKKRLKALKSNQKGQ